jgi:hypothetical protein
MLLKDAAEIRETRIMHTVNGGRTGASHILLPGGVRITFTPHGWMFK